MASLPADYYKVLEIKTDATQAQIREAYKRAALKHHPDRVPADSPERPARTKRFQQVNDAYYTLSDATRRKEYDAARRYGFGSGSSSEAADEEIPRPQAGAAGGSGGGGFPWSAFGFGGTARTEEQEQEFSDAQFSSAFEEMMREQGMEDDPPASISKFWSIIGGASGAAMGFIVANFPGAFAGGLAGNRLGAIRDKKGKSVYAVYQDLPAAQRTAILTDLAAKVFQHVVQS